MCTLKYILLCRYPYPAIVVAFVGIVFHVLLFFENISIWVIKISVM